MQVHEYYEELCALLPIGQLSAEEYQQLSEHLKVCPSCRRATDDFSVILDKMPIGETDIDEETLAALQGHSYRTRFLQRAAAEGVPFSATVLKPRFVMKKWWRPRLLLPSLAAAAATASLILVVFITKLPDQRSRSDSKPIVQSVRAPLPDSQSKRTPDQLEMSVAALANERNQKQAAIANLQAKLSESRSESQSAKRELSRVTDQLLQLQKETSNTKQAFNSVNDELAQARSSKNNIDALLVDQQREINKLTAELKEKEALAERERQLTLAAQDVRELMGARNLHILDVSDVDGNGQSQKSFGRVFLVEGKSLIFYAFDLGDRGNLAKVSFQAWGQFEGRDMIAKNLGVFYVDDHAQKRWVLKVDDPKKLSSINSVFVTVEPLGGGEHPTGKKLLYAYLGTQANHP